MLQETASKQGAASNLAVPDRHTTSHACKCAYDARNEHARTHARTHAPAQVRLNIRLRMGRPQGRSTSTCWNNASISSHSCASPCSQRPTWAAMCVDALLCIVLLLQDAVLVVRDSVRISSAPTCQDDHAHTRTPEIKPLNREADLLCPTLHTLHATSWTLTRPSYTSLESGGLVSAERGSWGTSDICAQAHVGQQQSSAPLPWAAPQLRVARCRLQVSACSRGVAPRVVHVSLRSSSCRVAPQETCTCCPACRACLFALECRHGLVCLACGAKCKRRHGDW
jgi:hypothetical protein